MKHKYSYSRLKDYSKCHQYFKFRHIDKLPVAQIPENIIGNVVHAVMRTYTFECYKAKATHLYDQWEKITYDTMRQFKIPTDYEDDIITAIKEYIEANEIELEGLIGAEEKISLDENYKSVGWDVGWFRAVLDKLYIVGDQCAIRDYKTGFNLKPDAFQFECYVWVVSKLYPEVRHFQCEFDFTRFAWKKTIDISAEELPRIEKKILNRIQQIEEDTEFAPEISGACVDCPYWQICPAMKNKDFIKTPATVPDAQTLIEQVIVRENELKAIKKALKIFITDTGELVHKDLHAILKKITSYTYDVPALISWANSNGYQIMDALSVDNNALKKVLPREKIPAELIKVGMTTRFAVEKIKDPAEKKVAKKDEDD